MENKEIKKAKKILEEVSQDEREQWVAELRQKYIMDQHSIYDAGVNEGIRKNQIEILKKMYAKKIDIETIAEITGLTEEEINTIINEE